MTGYLQTNGNFTEGSLIMIGNTRQTDAVPGNGMPKLRKRMANGHTAAERVRSSEKSRASYPTLFDDEGIHQEVSYMQFDVNNEKMDNDIPGFSVILWSKIDADFNAAYNISYKVDPMAVWIYNSGIERHNALRCQDDRLKAGMNMGKTYASL